LRSAFTGLECHHRGQIVANRCKIVAAVGLHHDSTGDCVRKSTGDCRDCGHVVMLDRGLVSPHAAAKDLCL